MSCISSSWLKFGTLLSFPMISSPKRNAQSPWLSRSISSCSLEPIWPVRKGMTPCVSRLVLTAGVLWWTHVEHKIKRPIRVCTWLLCCKMSRICSKRLTGPRASPAVVTWTFSSSVLRSSWSNIPWQRDTAESQLLRESLEKRPPHNSCPAVTSSFSDEASGESLLELDIHSVLYSWLPQYILEYL